MKYAHCIALSRLIGDGYYVDRGEKFKIRLSEAVKLGPDRVKIVSTEDDEGPPPPRIPSSGTLTSDERPNRQQRKTQTREE